MRIRSTLDRRWRRHPDSERVDAEELGDLADLDDGWEWEWVDVDDEPDPAPDGDTGDGSLPGVDPRIAARRDDVAQAQRDRVRRRLGVLVAVLVVVLVAGALTRSPLLDVDDVVVVGAERSDVATLSRASGIRTGDALVALDLDRAVAGVEAEPWVLDARAERDWSGAVRLTVVERTPAAILDAGAAGWLVVGEDRRVLAVTTAPPDLPVIEGVAPVAVGDQLDPATQGVIDVVRVLTPALRTRVVVVRSAGPDDIELVLQPTGTVHFGPATDLDERIRSLEAVFAQVDLACVDRIDLRLADTAVLTRVPACA